MWDALLILLGLSSGILSIILFFRVWGMTNNVMKIKRLLEKESSLEENAKLAILNGQSKLAKKYLDKQLLYLKNAITKTKEAQFNISTKEYEKELEKLVELYDFYELPKPE